MAYYSSSPQEFYYACEGYFAERDEHVSLMRNVALFASQLGGREFYKYWPASGGGEVDTVIMRDEMVQKILSDHKLRIPHG